MLELVHEIEQGGNIVDTSGVEGIRISHKGYCLMNDILNYVKVVFIMWNLFATI